MRIFDIKIKKQIIEENQTAIKKEKYNYTYWFCRIFSAERVTLSSWSERQCESLILKLIKHVKKQITEENETAKKMKRKI